MQPLKEVRHVDSDTLVIKIPEEYRRRKLQVIVYPINDEENTCETETRKFSKFLQDPITVKDFQMPSREERNAR